jgi:hypothetical protein
MTTAERNRRWAAVLALPLAMLALLWASAGPANAAAVYNVKVSHEANEVQWLHIGATAGTFRLSFGSGGPGASETGDIALPTSASAIESALNALTSITSGGGSVAVSGPSGNGSGNFFFITFKGGPLANTDVPELVASNGTTPLSGGTLPRISVEEGTPSGLSHADERLTYTVTVKNTAPVAGPPAAGDTLNCVNGAWFGSLTAFAPDVSYQWIRNGVSLGSAHGAQTPSYEAQPEDAGAVVQCVVTVLNPNSTKIEAKGTATTTEGSNVLTAVVPGNGTFAVGQLISGTGIRNSNTFGFETTGTITAGSKVVTSITGSAASYEIGEVVLAAGVPAGTTISKIIDTTTNAVKLELSAAATESGTTVPISARTAITGCSPSCAAPTSLTISAPASSSGTLSAILAGPQATTKTSVASLPPTVVGASPSATPPPSASTVSPRPLIATLIGPNPGFGVNGTTPGALAACAASSTTGWSGFPTANTTSGSATLSNVATTTGTGTLTEGSTNVSAVTTSSGVFEAGQTVTGTGIPGGTTIVSVGAGTLQLSAAATASGAQALSSGAKPFAAGQVIGGAGIPTTAGFGELTSGSATVVATPVAVSANAAATKAFAVGQRISGEGIPGGTTITAVSGTSPQTLTLSNPATASGTRVPLRALTTVVSVSGQSVTLSTNATATATGVRVYSSATTHWNFQWARNGTPFGPTTEEPISTYVIQSGDSGNSMQCRSVAEDVHHLGSVANSAGLGVDLEAIPSNTSAPSIPGSNTTFGPVTTEVELPPGPASRVRSVESSAGTCSLQVATEATPAKAICTRVPPPIGTSAPLAPGESFTTNVLVYLDANTPDHAITTARVSGGGAQPAEGTDEFDFVPRSFGLRVFDVPVLDENLNNFTQAGGHPPTASAYFVFNKKRNYQPGAGGERLGVTYGPIDAAKTINVDSPRGFVGNALAAPELCPSADQLSNCPAGSIVGVLDAEVPLIENVTPVYAIRPEFGTPAQFAFNDPVGNTYTLVPGLRPDEGYAIRFENSPLSSGAQVLRAKFTICAFGGKKLPGGEAECRSASDPQANSVPLTTNPTRCAGAPPTAQVEVDSWQHKGDFKTYEDVGPAQTGCENVPFEPEATLTPTNHEADSPTGLDVEFSMPTGGLLSKTGIAQANLDNAIVTFPKGMTVNPSTADGLTGCSLAQIKFHSNDPEECPESSRIGTVEIETPLIRGGLLTGSVYLAKQNNNPFNSAFGLYMSFSSPENGIRLKVAGKLVPDPETGQLVSTFTENPEWPFSHLTLHFNSGPRAPLVNPPKCGTYAIHSELSPWSAVNPANPTSEEIVSHDSTYEVTSGPGGSACPSGELKPKLKAGVTNPTAAAKTPFVFSLSREDGTQRFAGVEVANPTGLTAYLKGIPYCSDSALSTISGAEEAGQLEIAHPSCPAASQVGTAESAAGSGPFPFYVKTGKVYLAGPYKGAPVSLAVVTPAVAGPYDLGSVVVRVPLYVDPITSQVIAKSDPIPTVLHGIVLDVREVKVSLDRSGFTAAPTSCEPKSVDATVTGQEGATAKVSNRFQVGGCEALGFKPALQMRLFGGTHRGSHPKFRAILTPRPGDANIATASVALPHSEFLDQAHIRTVCTRVQFAAKECPQGSVYGEAEAITPLLDQPLRGPVYLRSSDNPLPDLVAALRGPDSQPIEVHVDGRIDSVNGGIRSTFEAVPDQPVSSFVLTMQGGKKGLLVNSRDICKSVSKATAKYTAQNGRSYEARPVLRNSCKQAARKAAKRHRGR